MYVTHEGKVFATEAEVLADHDQYETLHAFFANGDEFPTCEECGDTEEGLMHNNTERNIEPLLDLDACNNGCVCGGEDA